MLHRAGDEVLVVNDIGLERYLYGVVPAEMPTAWPVEALRSQALLCLRSAWFTVVHEPDAAQLARRS